MNLQERVRAATTSGADGFAVALEEHQGGLRRLNRLARHRPHTFQRDYNLLPLRSVGAYSVKAVVVGLTVRLDVQREVEQRLREDVLRAEEQGDVEPSDATVAALG